jgi:hypothetical protein
MTGPAQPSRRTAEGRAYLTLRHKAKDNGRPFTEYLTLFALEGFLKRLVLSGRRDDFILKGGALLAAFGQRRPTRDIDLAGIRVDNDLDNLLRIARDIASLDAGDGLKIDSASATIETIRDNSTSYNGARVTFKATLNTAKIDFHVDFNVGDPITPAPSIIAVPCILEGVIEVVGYPIEMVIAEKLITAVELGAVNTRWRDFVDMHRLSSRHTMSGSVLVTSCSTVAAHRGVRTAPIEQVLEGLAATAQLKWQAWLSKQKIEADIPTDMATILEALATFADPILDRSAERRTWLHLPRAWRGAQD